MRRTILVVDDDTDLRTALVELLLADGYRVVSAAHGAEAMSLLGREMPSLIVTDVHMPVMDGWELISQLRARSRLRLVPVIVLSAESALPDRLPESVSFLPKTGAVDLLLRTVRNRLGMKRSRSARPLATTGADRHGVSVLSPDPPRH